MNNEYTNKIITLLNCLKNSFRTVFDGLPEPDFALATVIFIILQFRTVKHSKPGQKPPNCSLTETRATGELDKVGNQLKSV